MKALSINQPWADLIVRGIKDVENRTWSTNYRGPLLIHASKAFDDGGHLYLQERRVKLLHPKSYVRGAIIGCVMIEKVLPSNNRCSKWHEAGCYGWYFTDAEQFDTPIHYRGALNLFEVPDEVVKKLLRSGK